MVALTYFVVSGTWVDSQSADPAGSTNTAQMEFISAFVDFIPRLPAGFSARISSLDMSAAGIAAPGDAALAIAPITARTIDGALCSINSTDTPGVSLVSNSAPISSALTASGITDLIYDVRFRAVTYASANQLLNNFSFVAPVDATPINLCDPMLARGTYGGP